MKFEKKDFDFASHGVFFAFSQEQFDKSKIDWLDYVSAWMWMFLPKETAKETLEAYRQHNENEKKRRIEEVWLKNIILCELDNHECYYTGDIEDAMETLEHYGATREQVMQVFKNKKAEI